MRLILIRHGETPCNTEAIWHGWDQCRLTTLGLLQAERVAMRLRSEPLSAVYTSDTLRAVETANAIAARQRVDPVFDRRFRERNPGEFEGIPVAEVHAKHPGIEEERARDLWNWRPPGGETFKEVLDRCLPAIDELKERHPDETIAVVTHMSPVRLLISHFTGASLDDTYQMTFPSTGVSILKLRDEEMEIEAINDASHLSASSQ